MTQTQTKSELILLEPIIEKYTIARTLDSSEQRELYQEVSGIVEKDYKNAPAFQTYWKFNEETGEINGSNLFYLIVANRVLTKKGQRTLTFNEGMKIDKDKKLTNDVYRDFGLVVYNSQEPNKEIAKSLVKQAEEKGWELPVLAHPLSLEMSLRKANNEYGLDILFLDDDSLIISGEQAKEALKQFNYKENSGVRRLDRYRFGGWYAGWDCLANSYGGGRVDWVRGEATRADLEAELLSEIDSAVKSELEALNKKIEKSKESALKMIRG